MDGFFYYMGRTRSVYYGWSVDQQSYSPASSGGVITEIASWMLENKIADAVLHVCTDPDDAIKIICCESTSREEVALRSGSRYAISHPFKYIQTLTMGKNMFL